jgi:hypothetical protein
MMDHDVLEPTSRREFLGRNWQIVSSGVSGSLPEGIDSCFCHFDSECFQVVLYARRYVWRRSTALWSASPVLAVDTFDERRSVVPLKSPPLAVDKLWQVLSTLSNLYVVVARLGVFPKD